MTSVVNKELFSHFAAITLDTAYADGEADAIYVGVGGNIQVIRPDGTQVAFLGAVAGSIIPVRSIRVELTATTATDLVALYTRKP